MKVRGEVKRGRDGWEAWVIDPKSGARFRLGWWQNMADAARYLAAALS